MKKVLLLCVLACLGYTGWHHYKGTQHGSDSSQAGQSQAKQPQSVATTTPVKSALAVSSPAPVTSAAPTRHVALAGTLTKEELITAINKDAKESSLEEILGAPSFTKPTGWSSLYCWKGKLDIGDDSPVGIAVEVVKYKDTPLIVGIYDAASKSIIPLPWRNKVAEAYNDAMQWYYNDQENKAAIAAQNRQLQVYKQAAADSQRWARSQSSQYVSPLSASAVRVGSSSDDQPQSAAISAPTETRAENARHLYFQASDAAGWHGPVRNTAGEAQEDAGTHRHALGDAGPDTGAHPLWQ